MSAIYSKETTLPDGAWKDSFDKLLDNRSLLRINNLVKQNINASYNMNSSYENSGWGHSPILKDNANIDFVESERCNSDKVYLNVPSVNKQIDNNVQLSRCASVSTPLKPHAHPFNCTVSPIDMFRFINFYGRHRSTGLKKNKNNAVTDKERVTQTSVKSSKNSSKNELNKPGDDSPWTLLKKKRQRHVQFKEITKNTEVTHAPSNAPNFALNPGKWRKSLNQMRRSSIQLKANVKNTSLRKSICICSEEAERVVRSARSVEKNFKAKVLQFCNPHRILTFKEAYTLEYLSKCRKIGEGSFGEVFLYSDAEEKSISNQTVLKIIPIEGQQLINGEIQKTFEQILPEIVITIALSGLSNESLNNVTNGFVNVHKVRCVRGKYPDNLINLWEEYDRLKESENDHPNCFNAKQLYIILELSFGGKDFESWVFRNAEQSYFILQQVILTLAVGEEAYQLEHRDLHWGNILILSTTEKHISYKLRDNLITIPTKGAKISIIDYTLSRITYQNYCHYCDLSNEKELFSATGDYQFDIYRMMRETLNDKWDKFEPKTNVFWISYLIDKLLNSVSYRSTRSAVHTQYMKKLLELNESILQFHSCVDCVRHLFVST